MLLYLFYIGKKIIKTKDKHKRKEGKKGKRATATSLSDSDAKTLLCLKVQCAEMIPSGCFQPCSRHEDAASALGPEIYVEHLLRQITVGWW